MEVSLKFSDSIQTVSTCSEAWLLSWGNCRGYRFWVIHDYCKRKLGTTYWVLSCWDTYWGSHWWCRFSSSLSDWVLWIERAGEGSHCRLEFLRCFGCTELIWIVESVLPAAMISVGLRLLKTIVSCVPSRFRSHHKSAASNIASALSKTAAETVSCPSWPVTLSHIATSILAHAAKKLNLLLFSEEHLLYTSS